MDYSHVHLFRFHGGDQALICKLSLIMSLELVFLFSPLLHKIAGRTASNMSRGKRQVCRGVGTVYPWAMFLQDIPGSQCSLSQPKRPTILVTNR